jgi:hypothetical protein
VASIKAGPRERAGTHHSQHKVRSGSGDNLHTPIQFFFGDDELRRGVQALR